MPYKDPERHREHSRQYYQTHREEIRATQRLWCQNNRERIREDGKRYRLEHPEQVKATRARYNRAHREERKAKSQKYHQEHPEVKAESHRFRTYGLTPDNVSWILLAQGGKCLVCGRDLGERFEVDHDHATGVIRGLLHKECNMTLGTAHDDPVVLEGAARYLRENGYGG